MEHCVQTVVRESIDFDWGRPASTSSREICTTCGLQINYSKSEAPFATQKLCGCPGFGSESPRATCARKTRCPDSGRWCSTRCSGTRSGAPHSEILQSNNKQPMQTHGQVQVVLTVQEWLAYLHKVASASEVKGEGMQFCVYSSAAVCSKEGTVVMRAMNQILTREKIIRGSLLGPKAKPPSILKKKLAGTNALGGTWCHHTFE